MTLLGAVYYSLRGLNTYFALNLFFLVVLIVRLVHKYLCAEPGRPTQVLPVAYTPSPQMCRLVTGLLLCLVLASFVTGIQGITILRTGIGLSTPWIVFTSTWPLFVLLTLLAALFVGSCIYRFHELLAREKREWIQSLLNDVRQLDGLSLIERTEQEMRVHELARKVRTIPLEMQGTVSILAVGACQLVNAFTAAMAIFEATKSL